MALQITITHYCLRMLNKGVHASNSCALPVITQVRFSNVIHIAISLIQDCAEDTSVSLQDRATILLACRRPKLTTPLTTCIAGRWALQ